ncbi:MAG: hypothetical protein DRG30_01155 [Epsilonproteobacteria bacterium]|nr:MAG: hypothetical protein DRG30_01155 [Campylobacterota bacterium]
MAYEPSKLAGNVNASAVGSSLFSYGTTDTRADVAGAGYFSTEDTSFLTLTTGDVIQADCSDGYALFLVTASSNAGVTVKQTMSEV